MTALEVLLLVPLTFAITMLWAPALIQALRELKFGKQIRLEGPQSHFSKAGTPTMGGLLFVGSPLVVLLLLVPDRGLVLAPLAAIVLFGLAGALDDYANMKSKEGLGFRVRYKFIWHGLLALALAWWLAQDPAVRVQRLPGGAALDLGWLFIPFAALVIFSTAAGVNEVDGLDGLAGGTALAAFGSYLVLALAAGLGAPAAVAAAMAGAILGFLWFNVHPARLFMGDAGALALGAGLAVVALQTRWVFLLPVIGLVFVIDLVSVILQVSYFKLTHGKRIFRMTPIHHGLELGGWPETLVVGRFWVIGFIAAVVGVALGQS
jgi:phospho-N-acetylmuramoyl-pentapeptide-transferase